MQETAVSKALSRPSAGVWKGEAALGSLAYHSRFIKRNMTSQEFEIEIKKSNAIRGLKLFDKNISYSPENIASRYRVVASTGDAFVQAQLGNDGIGGTSSGYQAIILHDTVNDSYALLSAGVTGDTEFYRTAKLVAQFGFQHE